jgi:ABC-2 type transport system permease protein
MLFTLITNVVYIIVIYYLWKSIYANSLSLNGMSFEQTFLYLALASSVFVLFKTFTDWAMSEDIVSGAIRSDLIRPADYQGMVFARAAGQMLTQALLITLPTALLLLLVFRVRLPLGINLPFFLLSIALAYVLSFLLDYMVGLTGFYTQSLWGISTTKEILVLTLSGSLIPLPFFPEGMREVLELLPFQAIYNTPVSMIANPALGVPDYLNMIGVQLIWVLVLLAASRLFFAQASKVLTINGG